MVPSLIMELHHSLAVANYKKSRTVDRGGVNVEAEVWNHDSSIHPNEVKYKIHIDLEGVWS